jgi:glutaredoxin-like protein
MSLLPEEQKERIKSQLAQVLVNPVRLIMFTQQMECRFCSETKELIIELAALNDKIQGEVHDLIADSQLAQQFGVDMIPALILLGEKDYGIRFYGFPFGFEFTTLMEALKVASSRSTDLSAETKEKLKQIKTPVNIKVLVTLTCPHCPEAATLACKFAFENDLIKAEVVDVSEFPQLAQKYAVLGTPKVVINERVEFVGAVPENIFLAHVLIAAQQS